MSLAFDYRSNPARDMAFRRVVEGLGAFLHSPEDQPATLPTGSAPLDRLLGGGLPVGRLVEVVGAQASGKLTLSLKALRAALERGEPAALVDTTRSVCPPIASDPIYEDLLVVRAPDPRLGFQGLDTLLRTGVFTLLVFDLSGLGRPPASAAVTRLVREARLAETALLVLSERRHGPLLGSLASARLSVAPLACARALEVTLEKSKLGPSGASVEVPLAHPLSLISPFPAKETDHDPTRRRRGA